MILPSKELFNKVMDIDEKFIEYITIEDDGGMICKFHCTPNELHKTEFNKHLPDDYYNTKQDFYKKINIFEFAFKIKEWVYNILKLDYIDSGVYTNNDYKKYYRCMINKFDEDTCVDEICLSFKADTEIEAIIEAGEWVLNNLKELK